MAIDHQLPPSLSHLAAALYAVRSDSSVSCETRAQVDAAIADFEAEWPHVQAVPAPGVAPDGAAVPREIRYLVSLPGHQSQAFLAFWVTAPAEHDVYAALPAHSRVTAHIVDASEPGVLFTLPDDMAAMEEKVRQLLAKSAPRDALSDMLDQAAAVIQIMCRETEPMPEKTRQTRLGVAREIRELRVRHRYGRALAEHLRQVLIGGIEEPSKLDVERIFALLHLPPDEA